MFKTLEPHCEPQRKTKHSAGIDLCSKEDITISAGTTKIIPLGVQLDIPSLQLEESINDSHYVALHIRSSLAFKGLVQNNGVGIIDLDYPDELGLIVSYPMNKSTIVEICKSLGNKILNLMGRPNYFKPNEASNVFVIKKGERVAQAILMKHSNNLTDYTSETERTGGFGSTDSTEKDNNDNI